MNRIVGKDEGDSVPRPIDIIITTNSPGEVAGWVRPAVDAIKALPWETEISVFVPPCMFASGAECGVIGSLPGVARVIGPKEVIKYATLGVRPKGFVPAPVGLVLFLGGDLAYAAILAKRLRYPAIAYTEGLANWPASFARFAVPYTKMGRRLQSKGVSDAKLRVIGNLMLDAVKPELPPEEVRGALGIGQRPLLLLMPGSRPQHLEYMAPFLLQASQLAAGEITDIAPIISLSPFVSEDQLAQALAGASASRLGFAGEYIPGRMTEDGRTAWESPGIIRTPGGLTVPILRGRQYDLMGAADLALSLPGTNTAELAYLNVPMIVVLQLEYPERIPLEGLPGLIGGIPVLGGAIKRWLLPKVLAKVEYTAWPNRLAGAAIVPEVRGKISPEDVGRQAIRLLSDPRRRADMSQRLAGLAGETGASVRLAHLVAEVLTERYGAGAISERDRGTKYDEHGA